MRSGSPSSKSASDDASKLKFFDWYKEKITAAVIKKSDNFEKSIILKPSIVLLFSIKPVIYGSIAAKLLKIKSIVMITGLGTVFITENWLTKFVKILYKLSLSYVSKVFFQNIDDKELFLSNKNFDLLDM